jgi:cellulose synthase/poly-beta-1,6-N-acetylglucosamine synthase-like glycosyltransferase
VDDADGREAVETSAKTVSETTPRVRVSIVMAVRNGGEYLPEAVESVLSQTFADWELVVVDDGSIDGSGARLDDYASRDTRIHVEHRVSCGQAKALSDALELCRGDYMGNLDADDAMLPERLEQQVRFLDAHPDVGLLGSAAEFMDESGRPYGTHVWPTSDRELRQLLQRYNPFFHSAVMLRAAVLRMSGGYDPKYTVAHDYDLWMRMARHGRIANLPMPLIRYRTHPQSLTRSRRQLAAYEALSIQWTAVRRGWHNPLSLVYFLRPLFYLLAPQAMVEAVYQRRARRNRGIVVRTASLWPRPAGPKFLLKAMRQLRWNP